MPIEVRSLPAFDNWLGGLRDIKAKARIIARIDRLSLGNPGDHRSVGKGVRELRIDYGPGYRVYYAVRGSTLVILLAGGDKSSQGDDIERALELNEEL